MWRSLRGLGPTRNDRLSPLVIDESEPGAMPVTSSTFEAFRGERSVDYVSGRRWKMHSMIAALNVEFVSRPDADAGRDEHACDPGVAPQRPSGHYPECPATGSAIRFVIRFSERCNVDEPARRGARLHTRFGARLKKHALPSSREEPSSSCGFALRRRTRSAAAMDLMRDANPASGPSLDRFGIRRHSTPLSSKRLLLLPPRLAMSVRPL